MYKLIVAVCQNNGIGFNNTLPWNIKSDLIKFSKLTKGKGNNAIIMGKNTWESLPKKPLPNRFNIILSNTLTKKDLLLDEESLKNVEIFKDINDLNEYCKDKFEISWVIGGEQIYKKFLDLNLISDIYLTYIDKNFNCNVFFPQLDNKWKLIISENLNIPNNYNCNIFNKIYRLNNKSKNTN